MIRKILVLVFGMSSAFCSAVNIDTLFVKMPLVDLLSLDNKLDLLDLYNAHNRESKVTNLFGGETTLQRKTDMFLSLQLTSVSKLELLLLPTKTDTIILTNYIITSPGVDSRLGCYDLKWKLMALPNGLGKPSLNDFAAGNDSIMLAIRRQATSYIGVSIDSKNASLAYQLSSYPSMKEDSVLINKSVRLRKSWNKEKGEFVSQPIQNVSIKLARTVK